MFEFFKNLKKDRGSRPELEKLFAKRGINFVKLHPTIQTVIVQEVALSKNPEQSLGLYLSAVERIEGASAEEKARALVAHYEDVRDMLST